MGGKLSRQGLIKLSEFVTHCGRDRLPIIWFQDTSGIDVGELAEKAELLGLEQRPRGRIQSTTIVPGSNMSFGGAPGEAVPTRGRSIDHIGFGHDDLEAFCERLKAKGIEFDVEYREIDSIALKIAFIGDPADTFSELTEGYDAY